MSRQGHGGAGRPTPQRNIRQPEKQTVATWIFRYHRAQPIVKFPHQRIHREIQDRLIAVILTLSSLLGSASDCRSQTGRDAAPRKVLFFDLWKLDYWDNIELRQGEPRWLAEGTYNDPAVAKSGVYFPTVWHDTSSGQWRMVHSIKWSPFTMMAAQSDDGIRWRPLPVPDAKPEGEKLAPNHVFSGPGVSGGCAYIRPDAPDGFRFRIFGRQNGDSVFQRALKSPNHPWHQLAKTEGQKRYMSEAVTIVSRDGKQWELKTGGHWDWSRRDWHPEPPVFAFWNPVNRKHTMLVRPGWGDRRQCIRVSSDLKSWADPELLFQPDSLDTKGPVGMYGLPVHPVGNGAGFVGLLWMFHNSSSEPVNSFNQFFGTMDAQLVYSYDGVRFSRGKREPFLKLNPIPLPGCTQMRVGSIVETKGEVLIYSEAHRGAHGRERSEQKRSEESLGSLAVHRLRKDGWMYLQSRGDWARIQTKPFALWRPEIKINAQADYGEVRFQLTDEKSQPLKGFEFENCLPLRGADSLAFPLRWKDTKLEGAVNKVLRLEIKFRQANVFALDMAHHFLDAHDQWLLKEGKPVEALLFDY